MSVAALHNEKELLQQISSGNETAFQTLFEHYQSRVFSASWKLTGLRSAAEDVVQEVFLKLWLHKEKLAEVEHFGAYINTITSNHVFNMLRKVAYENAFLKESIRKAGSEGENGMDPIAYNELQNILHRVIAQLPPQQRKVYQLSRDEGLTYEEIAERLHIGRSTVKSHMIEALRTIREHLHNNGVTITLSVCLIIGVLDLLLQD